MAYIIIKDKKQTENIFVTMTGARARCNFPMSLEYYPVEWLHAPINPETGTVREFANWSEEVTLKTLPTVIQRLGGRRKGAAPEQLKHPSILDTSRLYCAWTEPRDRTAAILTAITP